MTSLFAPPELFSAYAFAEDGSDPGSILGRGTHLRLYAGLGASFPLTPFAVFKLVSSDSRPELIHITDRDDRPTVDNTFDLSQIGVGQATLLPGDGDTRRTVRVELDDPDNLVDGVILLNQKDNRTVAERNRPRWLFSAPVLHKLLAWGSASHLSIHARSVDIGQVLEGTPKLAGILALPLEGRRRWYTGLQDRQAGQRRVERGAPLRLNPMDRPDGPFDAVGPDEELARVEAMLQSAQFGGGLENLLSKLVDDPVLPWVQVEEQEMQAADGKKHFVAAPRLGMLQMAAIDPGLARFLGFSDLIEDLPDLDGGGGWDTLAIVGLFALVPEEFERYGPHLAHLLAGSTPGSDRLIEVLARALKEATGQDVHGDIQDMIAQAQGKGFVVAPFVAVAAPVPPWLPPSLPRPEIIEHRWQATADDSPSSLYRAGLAFPHAPLVSMTAMAAHLDGTWITRHDMVSAGAFQPPKRAKPRILGHEREAGSRLRRPGGASGAFKTAGLLSDQDIPAAAGQVTYRVRASDLFGRFGSPVEFTIEPPSRPEPPPPVLRFYPKPAEVAFDSLDVLSPGALKLTVAVPHPWPAERFTPDEQGRLGPAIVVPRIDDLAAGALRLALLELRLGDGEPKQVDLSTPGFFEVELPLPGLRPQEKGSWMLTGTYQDTAGTSSKPAALPVQVTDVRPPRAYPTGIGLFWASTPGPSPEVELKLSWPAPAGSLHRVYLTDQQGLGLTGDEIKEEVEGAAPSRGRVAVAGCNKVLAQGIQECDVFRLLTEPSIKAGPDGRAVLETKLPRSLATVQFLRVVPLGPDGAEPPFDSCGIVPVAVPDSRRPVAPRLEGEVDPATGTARLRVVADGLDRIALERDEPGLFTAGKAGDEPPRFRVRRAMGAVADPIYARLIGQGPLLLEDAAAPAAVFSAALADDNAGRGLEPFVRYVYWAEVQLPPERRVPAGVVLVDPAGGVTAVDPANAQSHPRPVSLPSAPRVLMHLPALAPAAPKPEAVAVAWTPANGGPVEVTIEIADPPRAHAKAIDRYRLAVWSQWPGQENRPITNADGAVLEGTWPDLSKGKVSVSIDPPPPGQAADLLTLRLGFVDPAGRLGDLATISVPPSLPKPQLSPIQIQLLVPPMASPPPRLVARWQILAPAQLDSPEKYTLRAVIRTSPGPAAPPLTIETRLDQAPAMANVQHLTASHALALFKRIARIQGTQEYFFFARVVQPLEVTVTLIDPSGQTATQTATRP